MSPDTLARPSAETASDLARAMAEIGRQAREAAAQLALAPADAKTAALKAAAAAIRSRADEILAANAEDLAAAMAAGIGAALLDRLALDPKRLEAVARGLEDIAAQPDPVGRVLAEWTRPNGLRIARVSVPLGVIGIIYESRPNVTADAGGLALKSGNAAILRGGSESFRSSKALVSALSEGLHSAGLPVHAVQLVPTRARAAVGLMLKMSGIIDIIVPRGGASLIERVQRESRIPVIAHLEGLCHTYIDRAADRFLREVDSAIVLVNASTQFADGGEFGMGAEIGISTQRLPPRGPVGAAELTTYKYLVRGNGQVRP